MTGSNVDLREEDADQMRLEEADRYRTIFESAMDGLVVHELDGTIVDVNRAFCEMVGYSRDELAGRQIASLAHADERPTIVRRLHDLREGGGDAPLRRARAVRKDGSVFHSESRSWVFSDGGHSRVLTVVRDVTDRVRAYELLEQRVEERTGELTTLVEVSRNVASTLEIKPLIGVILDQLRSVVDYADAGLLKLDGEWIQAVGYRGPLPEEAALQLRFRIDPEELTWDVINRRDVVVVDDVRGHSPLARKYQRAVGPRLDTVFAYVRSFMSIPLLLKGRVIGVLSISHSEPDYFTPRHASIAYAIAQQAAIALENARLFERVQETAVLEERQRLSRELHDSVSQALYSIALGARTARTLLDRDPGAAAEPLDFVLAQAERGLAEMRALIFELRPEMLEQHGLTSALSKQVAAVQARYGLDISAELLPEPDMSLPVKEAFYRVAQEALQNIVKHAGATRACLALTSHGDDFVLKVCDNGRGFDPGDSFPGHLGLSTMRERMLRLGGDLELESRPGGGTTIRARVPALDISTRT